MSNFRKMSLIISLLLIMVVTFAGCGSSEKEVKELDDNQLIYYHVSLDSTKLVPEYVYVDKKQSAEDLADEMIESLVSEHSTTAFKSVMPENVIIQKAELREDGSFVIDMSKLYYDAPASSRVLCKASLVKSLTQISGINSVVFTVDEQPLTDGEKIVSTYTADSFVDEDSNLDENQVENVKIYFTNVNGDMLESMAVPINMGGKVSAEEQVLEELISGTHEKGYYNTIPKDTRLLSVSTKDGVCYVDFSKEFTKIDNGVKDQIVVYSVVNSLCELSTVNKVAFSIEGEQQEFYNGDIEFNKSFERNLDLVEE